MNLYFFIFFIYNLACVNVSKPEVLTKHTQNENIQSVSDFNLKQLFQNAKDGAVLHIKPGIYLIDSVIKISGKSLTVYAYGSTFKMQQEAGYNALRFEQGVDAGTYKGKFEWFGGTFDGNKDYQHSPVAHLDENNKLTDKKSVWHGKGNSGLLTVLKYQSVVIKDVTVQDNSGEGIVVMNSKDVLYKDCIGKNGVPISENNVLNKMNTGSEGHQWTYFKVRSEYDCHATWDSVYTEGGSIGIHYSANNAGMNSLAIIKNCVIKNPAQDAVHIEHAESVIIDNLKATGDMIDNRLYYRPSIHVGNQTKEAYMHKIYLQNGFIDFRQGSKLKKCTLDDFTVISEAQRNKPLINKVLSLKNGTIKGVFQTAVTSSDSIVNVNFISSAPQKGIGAIGAKYVEGCNFSNLQKAANLKPNAKKLNNKIDGRAAPTSL